MSRFSARSLFDNATAPPAEEVLFKRDRPRHIDRFIDYFGAPDSTASSEPNGGAFLGTVEDGE